MQFWKVFGENDNDAHLILKSSMHRKIKLHGIFRLHALRFPEAFIKSSKKYDFRFFNMTQTSNFSGIFISATSDGSMHQTFRQRSIAARMRRMPGRINSPMHGSICVKADKPTRVWVSPRWLVQLTTEFQKYVATRPYKAFHTKKKMVRSTLSEIWSALLRRFFRFRSI